MKSRLLTLSIMLLILLIGLTVGSWVSHAETGARVTATPMPEDNQTEDWSFLFEAREDCQLPCILNMVPGDMTFGKSEEQLRRLADRNGLEFPSEWGYLRTDTSLSISMQDTQGDLQWTVNIYLTGDNDIVDMVHLGLPNDEFTSVYFLTTLLEVHGTPDTIRIFAEQVPDSGLWANALFLYWSDIALVAAYFRAWDDEDVCFRGNGAVSFHQPREEISVGDYIDAGESEILPISEISDFTNEEFSQILLDNDGCLPPDLPVEWPRDE